MLKTYKLFIVILLGSVVVFSACKKPKATTFTLQLSAKYGNQPFALNGDYMDSTNRYVTFNALEFYLSHIKLTKADGSTVNVADVAIFDFNPGATFLSVSVNGVEGTFTGISFACGLDSATNNSDSAFVSVYPSPLSGAFNMYWPMIKYQFEVLDGKWDTAAIPVMTHGLLYHLGTNAAYRQNIQLNKSFTVSGSPYTLTLYLDLAQIFKNSTTGETLNMVTEASTQSSPADNPAVLPTFADNFSHSFTFTGP